MTMTIAASPWQDLFQRLLSELDHRGSADWQADQARLDPAIYNDPQRYQAERDRLFRRLPLCLGHADQLSEPGSVVAFELCGVPVLMTRHRDGEIRSLPQCLPPSGRAARHRRGHGLSQANLVCPYHAWTYRLDGTLAGLPRPEAFPTCSAISSACAGCPRPYGMA